MLFTFENVKVVQIESIFSQQHVTKYLDIFLSNLYIWKGRKNQWEKGENDGFLHFLRFPLCFLKLLDLGCQSSGLSDLGKLGLENVVC